METQENDVVINDDNDNPFAGLDPEYINLLKENVRVAYYIHGVDKSLLHRMIGGVKTAKDGTKPSHAATNFLTKCLEQLPQGLQDLKIILPTDLPSEVRGKHKLSYYIRPGKKGANCYVALPIDKYIKLVNNQADSE